MVNVVRQCMTCGEILMSSETDESHTEEACRLWGRQGVTMKGLLAVAVREAVHLALIDSAGPETPEQREQWRMDIHEIPLDGIDRDALAQNVTCRLIGSGGWTVNGVYTGNATPTEVLNASVMRPDRDPIDETVFDLGLQKRASHRLSRPDEIEPGECGYCSGGPATNPGCPYHGDGTATNELCQCGHARGRHELSRQCSKCSCTTWRRRPPGFVAQQGEAT